jgi:hypothetical protein
MPKFIVEYTARVYADFTIEIEAVDAEAAKERLILGWGDLTGEEYNSREFRRVEMFYGNELTDVNAIYEVEE